ncbi:hypothetical protein [Blastococcus sp. URHD0036]|uniref:hypothetical protein n=1 Tax=Blastococcus sp. URHD0036 TaxID=1380356 RepID=UPI0012DDD9D5|nr:hypothetical protein [Blastococcus sp. URHD0036]
MAAITALGSAATILGLLQWPSPVWAGSAGGWLIEDVPAALWVFVLAMTVACMATAVILTWRSSSLRLRGVAFWLWLVLTVLAAAALIWNALYSAALSTIAFGAIIPIFHWLFTFVPAVVAGLIFGGHDGRARTSAALNTGVVTVPLFAMSWALLASDGLSLAGVAGVFLITVRLGVAPLAVGVIFARALGGDSGSDRL